MRKEYDFSRGVRGRVRQRDPARSASPSPTYGQPRSDDRDAEPLTRSQIRKLRKRLADLKDPVRYLVVAGLGPGFALYYNVSEDVYAMNVPSGGTLFKRRSAALAVKRLLGPRTQIVRCTTRRRHAVRVPVLSAKPGSRKKRGKKGAA